MQTAQSFFSIQSFFLRSATRQLNKQTKRIVRLNDSTFPHKRNETKPKRNGTITLYCLIVYLVNSLSFWQNVCTKKAQFGGELSYRSRRPVQWPADQKMFRTEENRREVGCGERQRAEHLRMAQIRDSSWRSRPRGDTEVRRLFSVSGKTPANAKPFFFFKKAQSSGPCEYASIARALSSMDAASTTKIKRKFKTVYVIALLYIDCWWSIYWSLQVWSKCAGVWSNAILSRQNVLALSKS